MGNHTKNMILVIFWSFIGPALLCLFMYGCWYAGKKISYEFFYEDQVIQTIEEYMDDRDK